MDKGLTYLLTNEVCEKNEPYYKNGLDDCSPQKNRRMLQLSCVHDELFDDAEKFVCPIQMTRRPEVLKWEWHGTSLAKTRQDQTTSRLKEDIDAPHLHRLDCYMKEVEVKDKIHEPMNRSRSSMITQEDSSHLRATGANALMGLMFYIGVNILCKEYLRRKPSYRLLGKYFLVASVSDSVIQ